MKIILIIALLAAMSGKHNDELDYIKELSEKDSVSLSLFDWLQLKMYKMMQYFGFWGILICASVSSFY